jgi:4-amino-4-deoxy-L-arabinose transferase-like glycosyltransferase
MRLPDLGKWPMLLGAVLCFLGAIALYQQTGDPDDGRTAAAVLVVVGCILIGAFIASSSTYDNDDDRGDTR